MKFEAERDFSAFWTHGTEWHSLLEKLPEGNPFLLPQWIGLSYEYFAGEEKLLLLLAKSQENSFLGILPVALRLEGEEELHATFLQREEVTPYADFILDPKERGKILKEALMFLTQEARRGRLAFDFAPLREDSPTLWALSKEAEVLGFEVKKEEIRQLPYLVLPSNFEQYLYSLKGRERQFAKTKERAERMTHLKGRTIRTPEEVNEYLDHFFRLLNLKPSLISPGLEAFFREIFLLYAKAGAFSFCLLEAEGWPVAMGAVFEWKETLHLYRYAVEPEAQEFSPGVLLLFYILREAVEARKKRLEIPAGLPEGGRFGFKDLRIFRVFGKRVKS